MRVQVQPVRYDEELKPDEGASISRAETPAASAKALPISDCQLSIGPTELRSSKQIGNRHLAIKNGSDL